MLKASQDQASVSGAPASGNVTESSAVVSPTTPEANMIPDVDDKVRRTRSLFP